MCETLYDAHNGVRPAIDEDRPSDHRRVAPEPIVPEAFAKQHDGRRADLVVLLPESASDDRVNA